MWKCFCKKRVTYIASAMHSLWCEFGYDSLGSQISKPIVITAITAIEITPSDSRNVGITPSSAV